MAAAAFAVCGTLATFGVGGGAAAAMAANRTFAMVAATRAFPV